MQKAKKKSKPKPRPPSVVDSAELPADEDVGKDFGTLINAPLSKGGHFVFKSEQAWAIDSSHYSELFTLNLKTLSAAIDCIPFNEYVDIPDMYFVSDQLTSIYNDTERGKMAYKTILDDLNETTLLNIQSEMKESTRPNQSKNIEETNAEPEMGINDLEEDLDFLLSLKEPVQSTAIGIVQPVSLSTSHSSDSKIKMKNVSSKPLDLEKWLDSVLDD
ncbi:hypothetical protein PUN28_009491 [Cardiocondyla obscurior]|uniref:Cell death regulator Aven n=1 Tax=Cardiocondyla obscurior TaxID=286306 RepID=A0AAW2FXH1_9HYME